MAVSKIQTDRVSTETVLVDSSIPVSGGTSWQSATHNVDISGYKYLRVYIYVHGCLANTGFVAPDVIINTGGGNEYALNNYWDSSNLGYIDISKHGRISVTAKTKTYAFDYKVSGYK